MAKYKENRTPYKKIMFLYGCILFLSLFQFNKALAGNYSDFNRWLEDELSVKITKSFEEDFVKEIIQNVQLSVPEYEKLEKTQISIKNRDFSFPEVYFNETRLKSRASYAKRLKNKYKITLSEIEKKYQVPSEILLAVWATESDFGRAKLEFLTLKTLAFQSYKSDRKNFFYNEFMEFLKLLRIKKMSHTDLYGSSFGAMGQPQFMPSSYNEFAVDFDQDDRVDIWNNEKDILASIANFLTKKGWVRDLGWGLEVQALSDLPCYIAGPDNLRPISSWNRSGIKKITEETRLDIPINTLTSLLHPKGEYGPKFLVTKNFYVLKKYNNSDLYALYVAHLSDRIRRENKPFHATWKETPAKNIKEVFNIQRNLIDNGFDVGNHDGLIGYKTRRSIGLWQEKKGHTVTCYPNY